MSRFNAEPKNLYDTAREFEKWTERLYEINLRMDDAITSLCEIRQAAGAMGDRGHDIACWATEALKALDYARPS